MPISFMFIKVNTHVGISCIFIVMPHDGSYFTDLLLFLIQGPHCTVM